MIRLPSAARACALFAVLAVPVLDGCVTELAIGRELAESGQGASAGSGGSGGEPQAGASGSGAVACVPASCGADRPPYACGNCQDDDLDGLTDSEDSECLGPCDNTEDSYFVDLPGSGAGSCRQDCYFDPGAGTGNDQCYSSFACDPESIAPDYPPSGNPSCEYDPSGNVPGTSLTCADFAAEQSDVCLESCLPLVPNGCDCFGCCELPAASGNYVWIGSTSTDGRHCTEADLDDESVCRPCTQVPSCLNRCEPCELCAGRLEPGEDCSGGEGQCPDAADACGLPGQEPCIPGEYCITGCCVVEPR